MSGRQTQTYLRSLFESRGISPRHRLGQNFLIDLNLHEVIAREAALGPEDVVLEVGCAAGSLTSLMARQAGAVVSVEIDARLAELAREILNELPNVRLIEGDALARKHVINPEVIDAVRSGLAAAPGRRLKLVANLPYNIATPLISNLLMMPDLPVAMMVVTIQRELADRMTAAPNDSEYSSLSVLVQALADAEIVRALPPSVFWPRPKVESAILRITPRPDKRAAIPDLEWYQHVVRHVFLHRRKHLRGALLAAWSGELTKPVVDTLLESLDLSHEVRPEALNPDEFLDLATALRQVLPGKPG